MFNLALSLKLIQLVIAGNQIFDGGDETLGLLAGNRDAHGLGCGNNSACRDFYACAAYYVQKACFNADAVFFVLQIVFCQNQLVAVGFLHEHQDAAAFHIAFNCNINGVVGDIVLDSEHDVDIGSAHIAHYKIAVGADAKICQHCSCA